MCLAVQVGAFPHYGGRWAEWNGHFRDSVRQFIKVCHACLLQGCPALCLWPFARHWSPSAGCVHAAVMLACMRYSSHAHGISYEIKPLQCMFAAVLVGLSQDLLQLCARVMMGRLLCCRGHKAPGRAHLQQH